MKKMNPVIRGIVSAVGMFAIIIAIDYIKSLTGSKPFEVNWLSTIILSVAVGILTVFGPDAAQRKKNRQKLVDSFKK